MKHFETYVRTYASKFLLGLAYAFFKAVRILTKRLPNKYKYCPTHIFYHWNSTTRGLPAGFVDQRGRLVNYGPFYTSLELCGLIGPSQFPEIPKGWIKVLELANELNEPRLPTLLLPLDERPERNELPFLGANVQLYYDPTIPEKHPIFINPIHTPLVAWRVRRWKEGLDVPSSH